jgi:hypothetical protein
MLQALQALQAFQALLFSFSFDATSDATLDAIQTRFKRNLL